MGDYFCGYYFKCQSPTQTLAVIPAFHKHRGQRSYSIQLITDDGNWNVPFSKGVLRQDGTRPWAVIGKNSFQETGLRLELHTQELTATGSVRFQNLTPLAGDIMGPFRFLPFLECRHSVFSMAHTVEGCLHVNGKTYAFQNAAGYMEGDRGRSFPRRYAWTQCCFDGGSLMLSVADIPLGPLVFTGVIGVVWWRGSEYRLATYLGGGAKRIENGEIIVRQGGLTLTARLLEQRAHPLLAPCAGAMTRTIRESPACRAAYRFEQDGQVLFAFETQQASFEFEYP